MSRTQMVRNSGIRLERTFYMDGTATDADGNVSVVVTRSDGTELDSGPATNESGTGLYSFVIAPQATLDLLDVSWSGVWGGIAQSQTDEVEVVGGVYLTLAEMRALPGLADMARFTNDQLTETRMEFEDLAERYTGQAWVPRFARTSYSGRYGTSLLLDHYPVRSILSASASAAGVVTAFTTTNWQVDPIGRLVTDGDTLTGSMYGERNLVVAYEHGEDAPPAQLKRACREWVQATLLSDRSQVSRTVLSVTDPSGFSTRYGTIDWDKGRPTGIESVDAVLNGLGRKAPSIA